MRAFLRGWKRKVQSFVEEVEPSPSVNEPLNEDVEVQDQEDEENTVEPEDAVEEVEETQINSENKEKDENQ